MTRRRGRRPARLLVALLVVGMLGCAGPFRREIREPKRTWFRAYAGPMRPEQDVAIVCKSDSGAHIVSLRGETDSAPIEARHERWHFPTCIEVLPGAYALTVSYFARSSDPKGRETFTTEAPPITVDWVASPGAYLLEAKLGAVSATPGKTFRKPKHYGAAHGNWAMGRWQVRIEPVASLDQMPEPYREYREDWRRYEERQR